jgi:hypothetical protein
MDGLLTSRLRERPGGRQHRVAFDLAGGGGDTAADVAAVAMSR